MPSEGFASRFYLSGDGLKLHYRVYDGPPAAPFTVICLPGLTRNARDFEDLAPHLATRYRVLCLEFRGRGLSAYAPDPMTYVPPTYVRDLAALFKAEGLSRAVLIGTSLGGLVSTIFTAVMPSRVLGVVLNDIGPDIDAGGLARIGSYLGKTRPIESWEQAAAAVYELDGAIFPDYVHADWMRMARRRFIQDADGRFRPDYDLNIAKPFGATGAPPDLWPFFRRLHGIPTLLIRGATSDLLSSATAARMVAEIPGLQTVEVPGRGHAPYLDEPAALGAIDAFLRAVPARVGALATARRSLGALLFMARLKRAGTI